VDDSTAERSAEPTNAPLEVDVAELPDDEDSEEAAPVSRKTTPLADEYVVRNPDGSEAAQFSDPCDGLQLLKKMPSGCELIRRSDGARIAYNTRQKPSDNIGPFAPSYKRR